MLNQPPRKIALRMLGAMILVSVSACEGGRAPVPGEVSGRTDGLPGTSGIAGLVDHAAYAFNGDMRYTAAADGRRTLHVVSLDSDHSHWSIQSLSPAPGRYRCGESGLAVRLQREGMPLLSTDAGGACELTVTTASLDRLQGHFDAMLIDPDGRRHPVEEGQFHIELVHAIPDLDEDGLSDADDNCPFAVNPDQADADGNDVGDACEPADDE